MNGIFTIAINPKFSVDLEIFRERCRGILDGVRHCEAEACMRIMIPGEPEWEIGVGGLEGILSPRILEKSHRAGQGDKGG